MADWFEVLLSLKMLIKISYTLFKNSLTNRHMIYELIYFCQMTIFPCQNAKLLMLSIILK